MYYGFAFYLMWFCWLDKRINRCTMNKVWAHGFLFFFFFFFNWRLAPSSGRLKEDKHDLDWLLWYINGDEQGRVITGTYPRLPCHLLTKARVSLVRINLKTLAVYLFLVWLFLIWFKCQRLTEVEWRNFQGTAVRMNTIAANPQQTFSKNLNTRRFPHSNRTQHPLRASTSTNESQKYCIAPPLFYPSCSSTT